MEDDIIKNLEFITKVVINIDNGEAPILISWIPTSWAVPAYIKKDIKITFNDERPLSIARIPKVTPIARYTNRTGNVKIIPVKISFNQ